jgi:hypothetical protein
MSYKPRVEEYHVIGSVTLQEFKLDKNDFINFSSNVFDGSFESDFEAKITAATGIATTKFYIAELAGLTHQIKVDTKLVFPMLNALEGYINLAKKDLSKTPKMFGITAVRVAARAENADALRLACDTLFANVEKPGDFDKIKDKGLKDADYANLKALAKKLMEENDKQEFYKTEKATAIQANWVLFNDLMETIKTVQATGKILYKFTNKAKLDAYTMTVIIGRLRQDELHTLICGTVKGKGNILASKVKVKAKMSDGTGRTKTVKTDTKGYYELRGMKAGAYDITFTMPDGKVFVLKAEAVTNEEVRLDAVEPV